MRWGHRGRNEGCNLRSSVAGGGGVHSGIALEACSDPVILKDLLDLENMASQRDTKELTSQRNGFGAISCGYTQWKVSGTRGSALQRGTEDEGTFI